MGNAVRNCEVRLRSVIHRCRKCAINRCAVVREDGKPCGKWICFRHNKGPVGGVDWVCPDCIGRVRYIRRPAIALPNYIGKLKKGPGHDGRVLQSPPATKGGTPPAGAGGDPSEVGTPRREDRGGGIRNSSSEAAGVRARRGEGEREGGRGLAGGVGCSFTARR